MNARNAEKCREYRELRYMVVVGTHTVKHREWRQMVVRTVSSVHKGHPYGEWSPHRAIQGMEIHVSQGC